jgi:hypothetical protein
MSEVKIDVISYDPVHDEFALYLVENGPWAEPSLERRLRLVQDRIYSVIDVVVDGHLAEKFPESKGKKVRIQIDGYGDPPEGLERLVHAFSELPRGNSEYGRAIEASSFFSGLRFVTRKGMGRR